MAAIDQRIGERREEVGSFQLITSDIFFAALGDWLQQLRSIDQRLLNANQLNQVLDSEWAVTELLQADSLKVRGVIDHQGVLQSAASVEADAGALRIQWLATAPQNLIYLENPDRLAGASRALMLYLVKESQDLGFQGRIELVSLETSIEFYRKLGFSQRGGLLSLDPENAQSLLDQYGDTVMFAKFDTEELDRLEAESGAVLAVPDQDALRRRDDYKAKRMAEIETQKQESATDQ
ncbi:MAG: hypothetical protein NW237_12880 [Cyanobacteriota bacterium]|nr:hypothetical protein [Cyanobacteriota bacterium]